MDVIFLAIVVWEAWIIPRPVKPAETLPATLPLGSARH